VELEDLGKGELIDLVKKLRSKRKYGLVWESEKIREHFDSQTSLPVLEDLPKLAIKSKSEKPTHLLIEGDNYPALALLNATHSSKIDLIYIDPPYNTGNKDFKYNDDFVERDDVYRHSKWLAFMSKRLELAKTLLSEYGIIFVSIGEDEQANLKLLMDSVFGENNFIETFIWESIFRPSNLGKSVRRNSEYVLCYVRNKSENFTLAQKSQETQGEPSLTQNNNAPRTLTFPANYVKVKLEDGTYKKGKFGEIEMLDDLVVKGGLAIKEFRINGKLKWKQDYLDSEIEKGVSLSIKTKSFIPYYRKDYQETILRPTKIIPRDTVGDVLAANAELKRIFGESVFDYPKPTSLIKYLISICDLPENPIILDYFAGSGTTGDAVLQLNDEDEGNRQFILITNNEQNICEEVTYPRLQKIINGFEDSAGNEIASKEANLRYLKVESLAKTRNPDEMKIRIAEKIVPILCVKEMVFDKEKSISESFSIFKSDKKVIGIYNSFDLSDLEKFKSSLSKYSDLPKKAYLFTFDDEALADELFDDMPDVVLEPIPQKILELLEGSYV
jgi:adenine-specific DNA-methyltransferase